MRIAIAGAALLLSLAGTANDIYRWTDADGKVHYSEQPPPDVEAEKLEPPAPPPESSNPHVDAIGKYADQAAKARQERAEAAVQEKAEKKQQAARCAEAQGYRTLLSDYSDRRITVPDGKGGYRDMGEAEYKTELAKAQQRVADSCRK